MIGIWSIIHYQNEVSFQWGLCLQGRDILDINNPVGPFGTKVGNFAVYMLILFLYSLGRVRGNPFPPFLRTPYWCLICDELINKGTCNVELYFTVLWLVSPCVCFPIIYMPNYYGSLMAFGYTKGYCMLSLVQEDLFSRFFTLFI